MKTVEVFAPAKINLTLHVTGRREDGYHLLDSLVVFAPARDRLVLRPDNQLSLAVWGPEAEGVPTDSNNLALRAAEVFADGQGAALTLEKHLPPASGIGGGSADAAAAIRGMIVLRNESDPKVWQALRNSDLDRYAEQSLALGADVPMCLFSVPCRVRGIGDEIEYLELPPVPALLVNPRVSVSTASVFSALQKRDNEPMQDTLPDFQDVSVLIDWLKGQRNDLQDPAIATAPIIGEVLRVLSELPGCGLARMSGSGATCFALFETQEAAIAAGAELKERFPDWWMFGGLLGSQTNAASPRIS